jgi:hypothetical protein
MTAESWSKVAGSLTSIAWHEWIGFDTSRDDVVVWFKRDLRDFLAEVRHDLTALGPRGRRTGRIACIRCRPLGSARSSGRVRQPRHPRCEQRLVDLQAIVDAGPDADDDAARGSVLGGAAALVHGVANSDRMPV